MPDYPARLRVYGLVGMSITIAAIILLSSVSNGWSQTAPYPVKLIRIVNPVAPGGNQDIMARAIADQMTRGFGQPVVVESRPGSSATVGTRFVKSAPRRLLSTLSAGMSC